MSNYVIFTDSACDLKPEMLKEWGIPYKSLTFRFDDAETEYSNDEMDAKAFYDKMREGATAKTAAVNVESFTVAFEEILKEGKDILYIGFSTGLSNTYNSGRLAALQLAEKYPDRKIITVDSLAASAGEGLLVYLTKEEQKKGATIEEAAAFAEDMKWRLGIWFTVDDLEYLKRGGRVSAATAFVGNMLGIKPVLYMDNEGHLINRSKVRGRRAAIAALAEKFGEFSTKESGGIAFISHGDCLNDAKLLEEMLKTRYNARVEVITDVGPVIGAHTGPGVLALFYVANER